MNKSLFFVLLLSIASCVSVKKYNQQLVTPISPEKLKQDVDFAYAHLQANHPHLYDFISKDKLTFKFDSLKTTITKPLNPSEFYQKLSPVISEVRQGHLNLYIPSKRLTKTEIKNLKKQKGLLGRYDYLLDGDRLFVKDNADQLPNMEVGSEILEINDELAAELLKRYKAFITSDGYNNTYQKYALARRWTTFFSIETGVIDSVKIKSKYKDEVKSFYVVREQLSKTEKNKEKDATKAKKLDKNKDYNPTSKLYNRSLDFKTKDSSIAVMTIKTFSGYRSSKFYKESFNTLAKAKTTTLILDLRNNLGGSLSEIENLYRYLGADQYPLINDIEITSGNSMLKADYFRKLPKLITPLAILTYPLYATIMQLNVKKRGDQFYLKNKSKQSPQPDAFKGKMYVIINGSSFSASSVISSKLKSDGRATLVGEETGGANDGTVAGRYNTEKLPNSKITFPVGLMFIQPHINLTNTKKGVVPDVEMLESRDKILEKNDTILKWIIQDIESKG